MQDQGPEVSHSLSAQSLPKNRWDTFLSSLPVVVSAPSAYILCSMGESGWESRGCRTEKPGTMSCPVLPLFRFLLLRWCESALGSKGKQKEKRQQVVKATQEPHTHTGDVCRWLRAHTLRLVWWRRQRVTAGRLERRNLSRLQLMRVKLKLAACHRLYLYNTTSLVSRRVSSSHTGFWKWCINTTLHQNFTPINRLHI